MNRDFSLIDANIARVREGLRVIENAARFVLRQDQYFQALRALRHEMEVVERLAGTAHVVGSRVGQDVGYNPAAGEPLTRHASLFSIIRANVNRATEGLRTLAEFMRLYAPEAGNRCEDMRYRLYTIEYRLISQLPHYWLYRYFADGVVYPLSDRVDEIISFIEGGARIVQLRDKTSSLEEVYNKANAVSIYLKKRQEKLAMRDPVLLMINDHVDIAARAGVAGVHIGQDDGSVSRARRIVGSYKIVGLSTHSVEQARQAENDGADYIGIGPVFSTPTKTELSAIGMDVLRDVVAQTHLPSVAIGGITRENVDEIYATGIKNVAVVRSARAFFDEKR